MDAVNRLVHDLVAAAGGTLSAEHGIGVLKREEFVSLAALGRLRWMTAIKRAFDPNGIMNPGQLLPDRKRVVSGKSVSVRLVPGGCLLIKKKNTPYNKLTHSN